MFNILLDQIMKSKGVTNLAMSQMMDRYGKKVSKESMAKYRDGSRTPDPETIKALADILDVSEQDFFDPSKKDRIVKQEISKNRDKYSVLFGGIGSMENAIVMPIIDAGAGAEAMCDIMNVETIHIEKRIVPPEKMQMFESKNTVAIRVVGDSMQPKINENDVLFIDMLNGRSFVPKDGIYLVRYGDAVQIKHVQFLGNGNANLISTNSIYPILNTGSEGMDWEVLGKPFMRWGVEYFSSFEM